MLPCVSFGVYVVVLQWQFIFWRPLGFMARTVLPTNMGHRQVDNYSWWFVIDVIIAVCNYHIFMTTHEAAVVIISVVSVSPSDDNFPKPGRMKFIFAHPVDLSTRHTGQVRIWRSSGQGHGRTSKKV